MKDQSKVSTKNDEQKKNSQLLPSSIPPPPPPQTKDTTFLLSPWWSEETTVPPKEPRETEKKSHHRHCTILLGLQRYMEHKEDKEINWKEKCYLLANVPKMEYKEKSDRENLEKLFDHSNECSMVCFLKESQKLVKQRLLEEESAECEYNPLHGAWISVAKTPKRCRDHVLGDQTIITKKNYPDYYTINLAREMNLSSEHVTDMITKTYRPLQQLSQRYIDTWKDGTQQRFFTGLWTKLEKGDAFFLVRDYTRKLIENVLKPNDKK